MAKDPKATSEIQSINFQGTFFKKAMRDLLKKINSLRVHEEYPVLLSEDGAIDLVADFQAKETRYLIPIECKRVRSTTKHWLFINEAEDKPLARMMMSLRWFGKKTELIYLNGAVVPQYVSFEGLEITSDETGKFKAETTPIWEAADQICKYFIGFFLEEYEERQNASSEEESKIVTFPMLITNAKLYITEIDSSKIDIETGNYNDTGFAKKEVPFLTLNHPFVAEKDGRRVLLAADPSGERKKTYSDMAERSMLNKQGVVIVNSRHVKDFFVQLAEK